jgi:hypothetical protein
LISNSWNGLARRQEYRRAFSSAVEEFGGSAMLGDDEKLRSNHLH